MADISLHEAFAATRHSLTGHFSADEALALSRAVYADVAGYSPVDIVLRKDTTISDFTRNRIDEVVKRLLADEPLQYILGHTRFYGIDIMVTPAVLIPRPETEELVDIIVKEWSDRTDLRVLDLCTGSGCIVLALARNLKFPVVEGVDISPEAIEVACGNADALKVKAVFKVEDVLGLTPPEEPFCDIIVSNPPYVLDSEAKSMDANVLDYEPHLALFVPDDDPLRFYKAIGRYAAGALLPGGKLYLEINPLEVEPLCEMLRSFGLEDVHSIADMTGRQRFVIAKSSHYD
ncbi:peptide chain release factor N(5)-glutamine methyltransferase [uncultured Muribaculum sp.]|uniref:peptide chain release factor N(5)-glutamine methyltransferase n=1 Tax=uncultured Muribaculum sp. TaxID=1918613 RepID=UPI002593E1EA|nr:peptide chain release factor N(5)-glutamine methyltransferase [uncultured Muribaculum sp.]